MKTKIISIAIAIAAIIAGAQTISTRIINHIDAAQVQTVLNDLSITNYPADSIRSIFVLHDPDGGFRYVITMK